MHRLIIIVVGLLSGLVPLAMSVMLEVEEDDEQLWAQEEYKEDGELLCLFILYCTVLIIILCYADGVVLCVILYGTVSVLTFLGLSAAAEDDNSVVGEEAIERAASGMGGRVVGPAGVCDACSIICGQCLSACM